MIRHLLQTQIFHRWRAGRLAWWCGLLLATASIQPSRAQEVPPTALPGATNHVLQLDGDGDFVELPADAFKDLQDLTVEAWVKWEDFREYSRVFDFVVKDRMINLRNNALKPELCAQVALAGEVINLKKPDILQAGQWVHLALTLEGETLKLYFNGGLMADQGVKGPPAAKSAEFTRLNLLGRGNARLAYPTNQDFHGAMDEVRVWRVVRTAEQIGKNCSRISPAARRDWCPCGISRPWRARPCGMPVPTSETERCKGRPKSSKPNRQQNGPNSRAG